MKKLMTVTISVILIFLYSQIPFVSVGQDVLLYTSETMSSDPEFRNAISLYLETIEQTEGLTGDFIEFDSDSCLASYGVQVSDPDDWQEIRNVLEYIVNETGAEYIILLGGTHVVPRPELYMSNFAYSGYVTSDQFYIDFDNDSLPDEGLAIARFPEFNWACDGITTALETSIKLHNQGGFKIDQEAIFTMNGLTTPPYGFCPSCDSTQAFIDYMVTANYITFAGHGSAGSIYSGTGGYLKISINELPTIDLSENNPMIISYFPCSNGYLIDNSESLSTEFMRQGAGGFFARTTSTGPTTYFVEHFPIGLENGLTIGEAFYDAIWGSIFQMGDKYKLNLVQLCIYADPTLKNLNPAVSVPGLRDHDIECRIYPNPAQNFLNIEMEGACEILIMDLSGRIIVGDRFKDGLTIDIGDLESGVYILMIISGNYSQSYKIIVND